MRIRPLDTARDFPALAALLAVRDPEPPTPELLREWEGNAPSRLVRQRLVAFDDELGEAGSDSEAMVGFADAASWPWEPPHQFWISTVVAPDHRRRGLGTQLADAVLAFAREQGATRLAAEVRDNASEGLRFAERYGFRKDRHIFESRLHLADFDEQRFAGAVERAEAEGILFLTLADLGDSDEARRRLYDLNAALVRDIPGHDGDFMPFEQFQKTVCSASWYRPDGQIVAAVGGSWVGMAAVGYFANTNSMYNMFTGVDPAWRGKGIARALKLLAIACARRYSAIYISTNNDSENAPMLAINRTLGYQPEPGYYRMIREPAFG
ncbi:MAG TPA: GNAT family N-acetyltransferase [Ktedonobacterales bacterium]|jgi:GNAT superfamily N-acetyltransferase|nr:GNAT family N-acetyltransferase [Ktedonobacterales bacterium]